MTAISPTAQPAISMPGGVATLEALPIDELIRRYRRGIEVIDRRTFQLTLEQLNLAFLPDAQVGRWPVRVLLGHLADAEMVFVMRMRRVVAEEAPTLAVWDEQAFVDSTVYGDLEDHLGLSDEASRARANSVMGGFLATIHTLRQWTGSWLNSLPHEDFGRVAMHPERGPMTLKLILSYDTWHLEHHAEFLTLKLDRMLGAETGCCGGSGGGGSGGGCCGGGKGEVTGAGASEKNSTGGCAGGCACKNGGKPA